MLAIVGRPNVGKSALVNRILGRREAVVEDMPGVTRDRVAYKAEWLGRRFTVVDTGGWEPDARGINASVAAQAEVAVDLADAVLFVVDVNVGATATDEHVVRMLRASKRPVILVANKADDAIKDPQAAELWSLGLGEPWPVSALHGRGVADLLDHVMTVLPDVSAVAKQEIGGPRRVAILGRPNVGKSSLLNKAAGEERVVVNEMAGTTRDPVDEQVELGGKIWTFVDTAGIRKRVHLQQGADFYASLRTSAALEKAEVAVVVLDVTEPISVQDLRIIELVLESGRALVLAYNKWDLLDDDRRRVPGARDRAGPRARRVGAARQHLGAHRTPPREARARPRGRPRQLGHAHPDRQAQRAHRRARRGAPAPGARRQAAAHPVRNAGLDPPADLRAVHDRLPRPRLPALHPAPAARGLRLRGNPDRREHACAGEAQALALGHDRAMAVIENAKLSIIGAGAVGTSLAYAALIRGSAREVALYDIDAARVDAEVLDLAHGTPFTGTSRISGGADLDVVSGSNVIVVTAGAKQKPGQTRLDLAGVNVGIIRDLMPKLVERAPERGVRDRLEPVRRARGGRPPLLRGSPRHGCSHPAPCSIPDACAGCSPNGSVWRRRARTP